MTPDQAYAEQVKPTPIALALGAALLAAGCGSGSDGSSDRSRANRPAAVARGPERGGFVVSTCSYETGAGCPGLPAPGTCRLVGPLPDPACTPGALNPAVTQETLARTLCRPGGYTASVRPPRSYTDALKPQIMAAYGLKGEPIYEYELDHLVPLGVGGAAADPRNLWPEPESGPHGAPEKNDLAGELNGAVCDGEVSLSDAQRESQLWAER